MAALNLTDVMVDLALVVQTALASGRTAFAYPAESVQPGDAIVGYPEGEQPLTGTFGRGMDRVTLPVWIVCGLPQDESTRDAVSGWLDDSSSVVTAIEETQLAVSWSSARVTGYSIERFDPIGGNPLVLLKLSVDLIT